MFVRNTTSIDNIESRIVLCKALTSFKLYMLDKPFVKKAAIYIILKSIKLKKPSYDKRKFIAESPTTEQANRIFELMLTKSYIEFSHYYKSKPGIPGPVPDGTKLYKIGPMRMAECEETTWYKNRERKQRYLQHETSVNTKRCRALQQIYTMFGTMPFSYKTVIYTANKIMDLTKDKNLELTKAEKLAINQMKTKLYSHDTESFREVWQSLIKNNYILPHKVKTPDGYIKKTGLYKINPIYLKRCLAEII